MKRRTNISMDEGIRELAEEIMANRRFADFSGFIEQLIRDEYDRRFGKTPPSVREAAVEMANPTVRFSSDEAVLRASAGADAALALAAPESAPKPAVAAPSGRKRGPAPISYQDPAPPPAAPVQAPK